MSLADELQKLHELREKGALTEDEYVLAKKRLIEGEPALATKADQRKSSAHDASLKRFKRSQTDRWIGGVCGGLAELTDVPAWTWRILFVLTALIHGVGLIAYILLWIFVPQQNLALPAPAPVPAPTRAPEPPPETR